MNSTDSSSMPSQYNRSIRGSVPLLVNQAANGSSQVYSVNGFQDIRVQIFSAGASTADVDIEARSDSSAPFTTLATVSNPTGGATGGFYYSMPKCHELRLTVKNYAAGQISAFLEAWVSDARSIL